MARDFIVVGGPNGSGKTTFAESYATIRNIPYLGADKIAYELDSHDPYSRRIEAGTQFVTRLNAALEGSDSLIVESTLAGKSLRRKIEYARNRGFTVTVFFLFLDSAEMCVKRVGERVQKGGHVACRRNDVRRRFGRSLVELLGCLSARWRIIGISFKIPMPDSFDIALGTANTISVRDTEHFRRFQQLLDDHRHG